MGGGGVGRETLYESLLPFLRSYSKGFGGRTNYVCIVRFMWSVFLWGTARF